MKINHASLTPVPAEGNYLGLERLGGSICRARYSPTASSMSWLTDGLNLIDSERARSAARCAAVSVMLIASLVTSFFFAAMGNDATRLSNIFHFPFSINS